MGHRWSFLSRPTQIYFGYVVSSHSSTQPTTAQFRDQTNLTGAVLATIVNPHEPLGPSSRKSPIVISEIMYKPAPRTDERPSPERTSASLGVDERDEK